MALDSILNNFEIVILDSFSIRLCGLFWIFVAIFMNLMFDINNKYRLFEFTLSAQFYDKGFAYAKI